MAIESNPWEKISNYESTELVKRRYKNLFDHTPCTIHAREITSSFIHGRAYFEAALTSAATVKPLLLYYGISNLTRGLCLMLTQGLRETQLRASHGLQTSEWKESLNKPNPEFASINVEVLGSGTFIHLYDATNGQSLLRANCSVDNLMVENEKPKRGNLFSFGDMISRTPCLQGQNRRWGNNTLCFPARHGPTSYEDKGIRYYHFTKDKFLKNKALIETLFETTNIKYHAETDDRITYIGSDNVSELPMLTDHLAMSDVADIWFCTDYSNSMRLSNIMTVFSLSYTLGMLVRYYPAQ